MQGHALGKPFGRQDEIASEIPAACGHQGCKAVAPGDHHRLPLLGIPRHPWNAPREQRFDGGKLNTVGEIGASLSEVVADLDDVLGVLRSGEAEIAIRPGTVVVARYAPALEPGNGHDRINR